MGEAQLEDMDEKDGVCRSLLRNIMLLTGDMEHLDSHLQDRPVVLQLVVWGLRGVTRVILANNPLSGALILSALYWTSPWQCLLGTLGVLTSTLTAALIGLDSAEISGGLHGFNGMLVSLLMGVFSSAGDWYWWLLLPACLASATCVFVNSGLSTVLAQWNLPASVFPFNIVIILYLLCTGHQHPYFPHHYVPPAWMLELNATAVEGVQVMLGIPLGVGQIFACDALGPSLLILAAVLLYSPLLAVHALLGSAMGTLAAFLSAYMDIALSNLLGKVGLPACSWASTLTSTLMLLLSGSLSTYRIPTDEVRAPEVNLHCQAQWRGGKASRRGSSGV
ncbi:urea transporter 1 isoform 3-T3 [Synchiropus picturatus]